jgi:hypothetical protein
MSSTIFILFIFAPYHQTGTCKRTDQRQQYTERVDVHKECITNLSCSQGVYYQLKLFTGSEKLKSRNRSVGTASHV